MSQEKLSMLIVCIVLLTGLGVTIAVGYSKETSLTSTKTVSNPALSVSVITPAAQDLPITLTANGSIAAWQEAIIGAEVGDLRLKSVNVQIGETVKKGQVLATFSDESVLADIAQSRGLLAETEANLAEARLNADRARNVSVSGALSAQQVGQYLTSAKTAVAKVQSAKAQLEAQLLRLKYTKVLASDDGVISARAATLGAVAARGQELFRLIRQNRLEWQGEVTAAEMNQLRPGVAVTVEVPNVGKVEGKVRLIAPTIDVKSRHGLIYVDLPNAAQHGLRAGMFAHGEFHLGNSTALTIPLNAVTLREGFSYVFRLTGQASEQSRVEQIKVQLGRRSGDKLEVLSGLNPEDQLVASGGAFLANGDIVRVVAQ